MKKVVIYSELAIIIMWAMSLFDNKKFEFISWSQHFSNLAL